MPRKLNARSAALRAVRADAGKELASIALQAWSFAEKVREPTRITAFKAGRPVRVLGCEDDVRAVANLREARQVIELLLDGKRPRGSKEDQTRNWAIWRMINVLLEKSIRLPDSDEVVFPYPNPNAAAAAVVEGFAAAKLDLRLTRDRVLANYRRHFRNR